MAKLVLGPLLRYVGETEAVVWVETDDPCEVEVLGHSEPTFCVAGHHYALVIVDGLEPGSATEYEVALDGERRWPDARLGVPAERDPDLRRRGPAADRLRLLPRLAATPRSLHADQGRARGRARVRRPLLAGQGDARQRALDAGPRRCCCSATRSTPTRSRPRRSPSSASAATPASRRARRSPTSRSTRGSTARPGRTRRSAGCSRPSPCSMVVDDHDIHDDWNISAAWVEEMRELDWWGERERSALVVATGSISSSATSRPSCCARASCSPTCASADDGWEVLRDVRRQDERRQRDGARWSYCRDFGRTRLIVLDSRCGRVLEEGRRSILDDAEWEWLERHLEGDFDHLLIGDLRSGGARARAPSRRALGRGDRRRSLGRDRGRAGGAASPRRRLRSLGRVRRLPSSASWGCSRERGRASSARLRPRSRCSPATSTTPIWPSSRFAEATGSRAASGRRSARRFRNALRRSRAQADRARRLTRPDGCLSGPGAARGRRPRAGPLAPGRGPVLRQPGRDA